jgi:hypothetical protein
MDNANKILEAKDAKIRELQDKLDTVEDLVSQDQVCGFFLTAKKEEGKKQKERIAVLEAEKQKLLKSGKRMDNMIQEMLLNDWVIDRADIFEIHETARDWILTVKGLTK